VGAAIVDMCGRGPSGVCLVSDAQLHLPKMKFVLLLVRSVVARVQTVLKEISASCL